MILNKEVLLKFLVIFLLSACFFLGYFFGENAVGGGPEFYKLSWPIIQSFKKDFLFTIKNYGSFHDYTIPFSHILNAYINPFSNDIVNSLPADLSVITADGTNKANYNGAMIYATDLEGKITKVNLTDKGTLYQSTTLFTAESTSANGRYIYTRPEVTINNDQYRIVTFLWKSI